MSKNKNVIDNNPNESKKGMIIGIIFLIWFIGSIIAMFCLSKINTNYCIMIFENPAFFAVWSATNESSKTQVSSMPVPIYSSAAKNTSG